MWPSRGRAPGARGISLKGFGAAVVWHLAVRKGEESLGILLRYMVSVWDSLLAIWGFSLDVVHRGGHDHRSALLRSRSQLPGVYSLNSVVYIPHWETCNDVAPLLIIDHLGQSPPDYLRLIWVHSKWIRGKCAINGRESVLLPKVQSCLEQRAVRYGGCRTRMYKMGCYHYHHSLTRPIQ